MKVKFLVGILAIMGMISLHEEALALEVGDAAPCVVLDHIQTDGSRAEHCIRDPREAGQPVLLEFFSTTCGDCLRNLPIMSGLAAELYEYATTRYVSIDRNPEQVERFRRENAALINFEIALDNDRSARRAYGVDSTPTLYVLNSENVVIYKHEGVLDLAAQNEIRRVVHGACGGGCDHN